MLTSKVQDFLCSLGLEPQLNEVLRDNHKLFDTELAQPLIVGTQLYEVKKFQETISSEEQTEYMGLSLGEITALIASGVINSAEGLQFTLRRGIEAKNFSDNELQQDLKSGQEKRTFGVIKVGLTDNLKNTIEIWNQEHSSSLEKISITNFLPSISDLGREDVTLTADRNILEENILELGGNINQKMGVMQCPFHSIALEGLAQKQRVFFHEYVSSINRSSLPNVYSTRTSSFYNYEDSISESLAQYLLEPMQTTKTLQHLAKENAQMIVMMGEKFTLSLKKQYASLGGNPNQITYIDDYLRTHTPINIKSDITELNKYLHFPRSRSRRRKS